MSKSLAKVVLEPGPLLVRNLRKAKHMGTFGEDWMSFKALRRLFLSGVCCLFETFARLNTWGRLDEFQSLAKVVLGRGPLLVQKPSQG